MQFNSIDFMIYFPIVVIVLFVIPKKARNLWLLIASYYFYMSWNPTYALLIGLSTVLTYVCGLAIQRVRQTVVYAKLVLILGLLINLAILAVFKYGNFAIDTLSNILQTFHIAYVPSRLDILLPVGISFYTFQALGYVIDVYRGEIEAEKNLISYALFVSFFPQLVAGPIERSKNLLGQMKNSYRIKPWNAKRITSGIILMLWGLFMKMVIADRVSILANTIFDHYPMYGSTELILAAIGFAFQIYCDFSSYSLIAIGAAKVMGFQLMENFNTPYFAISIRDFWSRWHISLSTWFRDYLYIPLGGNRKGAARKALNLMVVFLASGLWHGAEWSFVIWGAIHGLYQLIGDCTRSCRQRLQTKLQIRTDCFSWHLLQSLITFALVTFAWIFFRADTIADATAYIRRIFIRPTPWFLFTNKLYQLGLNQAEMNILVISLVMLFLVDMIRYRHKMTLDAYLMSQNLWFRWTVMILLILSLFIFGKYGPTFEAQQFIYFQF